MFDKRAKQFSCLRNDLRAIGISRRTLQNHRMSLKEDVSAIEKKLRIVEKVVLKKREDMTITLQNRSKISQELHNEGLLARNQSHVHHLGHEIRDDKSRPFVCQESGCGRRYFSNNKLKMHFRLVHTDDTVVVCCFGECRKKFRQSGNLKDHMRVHTGERPFACNSCPRAFKRPHHLITHKRTHTGEKPFVCHRGGCGKRFTEPRSLRIHDRIHTGEKPYVCDHGGCRKAFSDKSALRCHARVHTGEKPYICNVGDCRKSFSRSSNLSSHRCRLHTNEKPFKCEHFGCKMRFVAAFEREYHHRTHTGEKPYRCSNCGSRFKSPGNLRDHERIHSGLKPYACSKCSKRFTQSSNRTTHERICKHVNSNYHYQSQFK